MDMRNDFKGGWGDGFARGRNMGAAISACVRAGGGDDCGRAGGVAGGWGHGGQRVR